MGLDLELDTGFDFWTPWIDSLSYLSRGDDVDIVIITISICMFIIIVL